MRMFRQPMKLFGPYFIESTPKTQRMDPPTIYNIFLLSEPKISKKMKFLSFWIFEVDLSWSSVHARARWNLKFDVISGGSSIKIENWMSGHPSFVIFILWTFSFGPRWTFDKTYVNAILNLGTFQPLWTFAVNLRNLEIDPACTRVHAGISFDMISGGSE